MKPKKIPRTVRLWLYAFGFYLGTIASSLLVVFGYFAYGGSILVGLMLIPIAIVISMLFLMIIAWRCRKTLEEWGLIEPKKEKA